MVHAEQDCNMVSSEFQITSNQLNASDRNYCEPLIVVWLGPLTTEPCINCIAVFHTNQLKICTQHSSYMYQELCTVHVSVTNLWLSSRLFDKSSHCFVSLSKCNFSQGQKTFTVQDIQSCNTYK